MISKNLRNKLLIDERRLNEINRFLLNPNNKIINDFFKVIDKYGGPDEINRKAKESGKLDKIMRKLKKKESLFVKDLKWLIKQRENSAFISIDEYRKKILGDNFKKVDFNQDYAVTLEISACQYF